MLAALTQVPYPSWLNPADNTWQLTAATFVGLMSLPALAVLYASIVQKKWAVNVLAMMFAGFSLVMLAWWLWSYKMGFGPNSIGGGIKNGVPTQLSGVGGWTHFWDNFVGKPGPITSPQGEQGQAVSAANTAHPVPLPDRVVGVLPVRLRRDHPAPLPRKCVGAHQVPCLVPPRTAVVDVRLRDRRVPPLGRRLLRAGRCPRLLRRLRHPHVRRSFGIRRGLGARAETPTRPTTCITEQPGDGCGWRRHPVARVERLQRR